MTRPAPILDYRLTDHAKEEMTRRQISEADMAQVLLSPEQSVSVRLGREVYQTRVEAGKPSKTYLLRVIVDVDRQPPEVVTAYRTGKISKYWRTDI